ncbi:MAG: FtsX-like permease family protein [Pyrinomonadaceae bacterium]
MPFELFLAIRYLRSRRKRRLARVTALVAILGISIGVAALIVALALANGFRNEMREKILRGTAHVSVMRADTQPMPDYREISARIEMLEGITGASGTTYDGAVVIGPKGSAYAVLRGIDKESQRAIAEVRDSLTQGSVEPLFEVETGARIRPKVILGAELARRTGLQMGEIADVILAEGSLASSRPTRRFVSVAGIFQTGLFEYDSTWIYLSLDNVSSTDRANGAASVISVQLADIYDATQSAAAIRTTLGNSFATIDWQEANRPLFAALALERRMGLFIIALIIFIAALNITTTLILVVMERRRDIGILNAMGATSRSIMGIFMIEGAMIGALGALVGVLVGSLACLVGNRYRLVSLPADVYSISNVPFNPQIRDVLLAAVVAFLLSFIATIYPARAASRVRPAEMLRDTQ